MLDAIHESADSVQRDGSFGCATWVAMENFGFGDESSTHHSFVSELMAWPIGMPTLGLGYAAAITLIVGNEKWRGWTYGRFPPIRR